MSASEFVREGRSPRARGKPTGDVDPMPAAGSIPACAGEASALHASSSASRVDPRVRGGSVLLAAEPHGDHGRSPRARGKLCR